MPKNNDPKTTPLRVQEEILRRLAEGETLLAICKSPHMPARQNILRWRHTDPEFRERYELARIQGMEALADQTIEIADSLTGDVQRDRLRVQVRETLMARVAPQLYGNRVAVTGAGGGPIQTQDVSEPRILAQKIAFFLASHLPTDQSSDTETNSEVGA